jgi:hypothetical protein
MLIKLNSVITTCYATTRNIKASSTFMSRNELRDEAELLCSQLKIVHFIGDSCKTSLHVVALKSINIIPFVL